MEQRYARLVWGSLLPEMSEQRLSVSGRAP